MVIARYLININSGAFNANPNFIETTIEYYNDITDGGSFLDQYATKYLTHKNNLSINCIQKTPAETIGTTSGGVLEFNANGETFLSINDSYMMENGGIIQQFDAKLTYDNLQFITINT